MPVYLYAQRAMGSLAVSIQSLAFQSACSEQSTNTTNSLFAFNARCRREAKLTTELHVRTKKSELSTQRAGHVANFHEGHHLDLA